MKSRFIASAAVLAAILAAGAAHARPGYLINNFNIFTGPGHDFERLARVPEDSRVEVHGCTPSFEWCRVSWRGVRGWMDGHGIEMRFRGAMMPVYDLGPRSNLPILTADIDWAPRPPLDWADRDFDMDGIPNADDRDRDGDGIRNDDDRYPGDPDRD